MIVDAIVSFGPTTFGRPYRCTTSGNIGPPFVHAEVIENGFFKYFDGGPHRVISVVFSDGVEDFSPIKRDFDQGVRYKLYAERRLKTRPRRCVKLIRTVYSDAANECRQPFLNESDAVWSPNDSHVQRLGGAGNPH